MPAKISDKSPGEKLLALYTLLLLQGDHAISLASLADALQCSKQTILRLLAQLEASGYGKLEQPISKGREHLYRLAPVKGETLNLGAKELAQLALCRNMLLHLLPKDLALPIQSAHASNPAIMYKGYIDYAPFEEQYSILLKAIQKQLVCHIVYQRSIFRPAREFYFAPMRIISYRESLAVLGWEVTDNGPVKNLYDNWLWLYVQRCVSVKLTRRQSAKLPDITLRTGQQAQFGIMDREAFRVRLLFNANTANYIHDRVWSCDQRLSVLDNDRLILEMTVRSEPEIISWIMSFGANVKVLEPAWLKEKIIGIAKAVIEQEGSAEQAVV